MSRGPGFESDAKRSPRAARVPGFKHWFKIAGENHEFAFRMLRINGCIHNPAVREALIRSAIGLSAIIADLDAQALRAENQAIRIFRVNQHGENAPRGGRDEVPVRTVIRSFPEAFGSRCIDSQRAFRILQDVNGTPSRIFRNPLELRPRRAVLVELS